MKKSLLLAISCVLFLFSNSQINEHKSYLSLEKGALQQKMNFIPNVLSNNYDIVYHRMNWQIDPSQQYIKGSVTSYVKATQNNVTNIVFDLYNNLSVDSIKNNNQLLTFTHSNDIIDISLEMPLSTGEVDSVTVYYKGTPSGSGGFGAFISSSHNGTPVMWTLSEPYGAADWWPCKQTLTDKIDSLDIYVETSSNYRVASNGKLISETIIGDKKTTHWKHRHSITTYLVAIAVTNYVAFSDYAMVDSVNSVEILNYVYPESLTYAETAAEYTVGAIELYSNLFIPYPFWDEKYGHAEFGWGGGMEHQTMSFMGGFSPGLIAHELAHQWFGDYVTCDSWSHIWINEGFATFCENVVYENLHANYWHGWKNSELTNIINYAQSGSTYVSDTTSVNSIFDGTLVYTKGGYILHMLRNQIGDEAFFAGIKEMLTNDKTANGFAGTSDFQLYMETAADTTLSEFFDDWFYGQGYPNYSIVWNQNENNRLYIRLSQTQTHSSVDFFEMRVPILLKGNNTEKLVHLYNTTNNQSFEMTVDFDIESIEFDPELNIIAPHPASIAVGVNSAIADNSFTIAPNPVSEKIYFNLNNNEKLENYEIYNVSGKLVQNTNQITNPNYIDVSNLPVGIYYLKINTQNQSRAKQFIKTN